MCSKDTNIINAKLTEKGISQCKKASESVEKRFPNIKRVLLSPLRRPVMTFENTFENYSRFKSGDLKISFLDTLRESLAGFTQDITIMTEKEKADFKYPELYDYSFQNKFNDPDSWFLENASERFRGKHKQLLEDLKGLETQEEKFDRIREELKKSTIKESSADVYERVVKGAKEEIKRIINEEKLQDGELLVVAHGYTNMYLTCKKFDDTTKKPVKGQFLAFSNAKMVEYDVHEY